MDPHTFHQVKRPPAHFSYLVSAVDELNLSKKNIKRSKIRVWICRQEIFEMTHAMKFGRPPG